MRFLIRQPSIAGKKVTEVKMGTEEEDPHTEERASDGKPKLSTFEDLLELAGTRGTWNILMFCMCAMSQ